MSELPENWTETTLGEVAVWGSGGTPNRNTPEYYGGQIPWFKTGELNEGIVTDAEEYLTEEGLRNSSAKIFPKGSIMIAMYGATIGKCAILGVDATTNQACAVAQPKREIEPLYLFHYLRSQKQNFIDKGKGGAQPNISQAVIKGHPIPLAPLPEQKRIVAKLDTLFGHLDQLKARLQNIPTLLKQFRQAVLTQAVTGKLTEEWSLVALGNLGKWNGGGTPSKSISKYWDNGTIPWITPKDMKEFYLDNSLDKISNDATEVATLKLIEPNSILIVMRSGILRRILPVAMNTVPTTINQDLKALTLDQRYYPKFIFYSLLALEGHIRNQCMKSGTTVESIEFPLLRDYTLQVPRTIEEQKEIVGKVESLFAVADRIEARYITLQEKIDHLPQAILRKAFRGELVDHDPNDEPAIVLLQRLTEDRVERKPREGLNIIENYFEKVTFGVMEIYKVIEDAKRKLTAKEVWKMSKFKDDIDGFYAGLKDEVEVKKRIKQSEDGKYLVLNK